MVGMLNHFVDHLIEANGVHKETTIDAINKVVGKTAVRKLHPVDTIACDWILVLWPQDDAWNVEEEYM